MKIYNAQTTTVRRLTFQLFAIAMVVLLMQSCVETEMDGACSGSANSFTLNFTIPSGDKSPVARADGMPDTEAECKITNLAVWAFDENEKCTYYHYFSPVNAKQSQPENGEFKLELPDWVGKAQTLIGMANLHKIPLAEDQIGKSIEDFVNAHETMEYFQTKPASEINPIDVSFLPMSFTRMGEILTSIRSVNVELSRIVSRADINVSVDENADPEILFHLDEAEIRMSDLPGHSLRFLNPFPNDKGGYNYCVYPYKTMPDCYNTPWTKSSYDAAIEKASFSPQYMYSNLVGVLDNTDDLLRPVLVYLCVPYTKDGVKVAENIYRVKLYTNGMTKFPWGAEINEQTKYYLLHNRIYRVNIHIAGLGAEGLGNVVIDCLPWNVEDKGMEGGKTVFSLSNQAFVAYTDEVTNQPIASISGFGKGAGTITATSGITLSSSVFPAYTKEFPINITMAPGTTDGSVTLTQDGQSKTVTVERKSSFYAWEEEITTFVDPKYTAATCVSVSGIKISGTPSTFAEATLLSPGDMMITNVFNGIYFYTEPGFSLTAQPANATATFDITESEGGDKTKTIRVMLKREGATISTAILPDFYVGAFWRHTETGERIIQQGGTAKYNGAWSAGVVNGKDWIRLDPNIRVGWPYGNTLAESSQLDAAAKPQITTQAREIKFRIGLTTANPATPTTDYAIGKPRYGLVVVCYNKTDGTRNYHPIFVRQGEDADYVLSGAGTVKWSPYNLVANGYGATENKTVAWPISSTTFADFPSRMGSRFTATNANAAYSYKMAITGQIVELNNDALTGVYAKCPSGYRVPGIGSGIGTMIPAADNGSTLNNSELYKSLFKSPSGYTQALRLSIVNGYAWEIYKNYGSPWDGGLQNRLNGYYADGLADRISLASLTDGCVLHNEAFYAPRAVMLFDATTNAHITFPYNTDETKGMYSFRAGTIAAADASTNPPLYNRWCWVNFLYAGGLATVHYTVPENGTQLIRCVKQ